VTARFEAWASFAQRTEGSNCIAPPASDSSHAASFCCISYDRNFCIYKAISEKQLCKFKQYAGCFRIAAVFCKPTANHHATTNFLKNFYNYQMSRCISLQITACLRDCLQTLEFTKGKQLNSQHVSFSLLPGINNF
jgi:hypothetical protein